MAPSRRWPTSATSCAPCSGSTPVQRPKREQVALALHGRGELWITRHDGAVDVFARPGSADLLLADERPLLAESGAPFLDQQTLAVIPEAAAS